MSQRERARAIVAERYEFRRDTRLSPTEVADAVEQVAPLCKSGFRGSMTLLRRASAADGRIVTDLQLKGPGGLVGIMDVSVMATPRIDGGSGVELSVGDFLFQKGSFGLKPSINGAPVIEKFVTLLQAQLIF